MSLGVFYNTQEKPRTWNPHGPPFLHGSITGLRSETLEIDSILYTVTHVRINYLNTLPHRTCPSIVRRIVQLGCDVSFGLTRPQRL